MFEVFLGTFHLCQKNLIKGWDVLRSIRLDCNLLRASHEEIIPLDSLRSDIESSSLIGLRMWGYHCLDGSARERIVSFCLILGFFFSF